VEGRTCDWVQPSAEPNDRAAPVESREERLRRVLDECSDVVWRVLRLRLPQGDAQDAVQNVFLTFDRRMGTVPVGAERAWLVQTAFKVAANVRRIHGRRRRREDPNNCQDSTAEILPDPEQLVGHKEARAVLENMLARMSDQQRVVFVLFELEEMTELDIAQALGISRGTVASRLASARQCFRRTLSALRAKAARQEAGG
jgi:RNA polymerase sigma-70 factor (ECF subfamily)